MLKHMHIVICGSMQFSERMLETKRELAALGHAAYVSKFIDAYVGGISDEEIERRKLEHKQNHGAIIEFWEAIQASDAILVLNYDKHGIAGYVGGNAFLEMGFAYVLGKKIFLLYPIPDIPFYKTEMEAMRPIVLDGDLSGLTVAAAS